MGDFYQSGTIATLHRLKADNLAQMERDLRGFAVSHPIALVLPALYSEFGTEAMALIREELRKVDYLNEIVVTLGQAEEAQFQMVKDFLADMPQRVRIIWNDGPRVTRLYELLEENNLQVGTAGKCRACWLAYGYVIAKHESAIIALHDCDIRTYSREILARLCHPVANPYVDFAFCKGYYARVTDRIHGRATRLYVTPLLRSLEAIVGHLPILEFLDSFRYPLAGEFAITATLAGLNRIPGDWGLEIGVLAEIFRNLSVKRVCQSELCETYDHKHQPLSPEDPSTGLLRMTVDIGKTLLRTLAAEGVVLTEGAMKSLQARYVRMAEDTIACHHADAMLNGLVFERHEEETAVATFVKGLNIACERYWSDPLGIKLIPNWTRVAAAVPEFPGRLVAEVEADNCDGGS
jgi:glucosyl-3-phosphoglycerate synthase